VIDAYFDVAHFWGDIEYVMALDLTEMWEHHRQAIRIKKAMGAA
jgi:hypothetical protein